MGVVQVQAPRQGAELADESVPLLFPLPRLPLGPRLLARREGVVQIRRLELANDLVEDPLVAGNVGLVRQHAAKAPETRGVRLGGAQGRIDVLARRRVVLLQAPLRIAVRQVGVVQVQAPRQGAELVDQSVPILFPLPRLPLGPRLLARREGVVQIRRLELANDLVEDLPIAGGSDLVRQHAAKTLETHVVRLGRGQRRLVVFPRRRGVFPQAPLRIELRQAGVVQLQPPGQGAQLLDAGGLLLVPRLGLALRLRRRLDDPCALTQGRRLPFGGAEDLEPGSAQKYLAGRIRPNRRFPTVELLFDPALHPLAGLPPFPEGAGPAVPGQGPGRRGQQILADGNREELLLEPVELLLHPLRRHVDHRLAVDQRQRSRHPTEASLRCFPQTRLAERYRPQLFFSSLQLRVHTRLDLIENAFARREALQQHRPGAAGPVLLPEQRRPGRRRTDRLLAAGEIGAESAFHRLHGARSPRQRQPPVRALEDRLLRLAQPRLPLRRRAHPFLEVGNPLAHRSKKLWVSVSYSPVKRVTASSSRPTCRCKDPTCSCKASVRSACRFCSCSYCVDNARKAVVSCRSISVIDHTRSCENPEARRRVTGDSASNRPRLSIPLCHRILSDDHRLLPQLPPEMLGERFRDSLALYRRRSRFTLPLDVTGGIRSASCPSSAAAAVARPVVLGALETLLFKVSPSLRSPLRVISSIGAFPVSRRFPYLADELLPIEVGLVQRPLQSQPVSRLRPEDGHVVPALAGNFEAEVLERRHHPAAVLHRAGDHEPHQMLPDHRPPVRLYLPPRPQRLRVQVRQVRRRPVRSRPSRVVRTGPAALAVERVTERIEELLPAGWGDVQAPPCREIDARRQDVHVHPAVMVAVQHRRPDVAVSVEARPSRLLELVEHPFDLGAGRGVLQRPGDHARRVQVLEGEAVSDPGNLAWIPAQDLDRRALRARRVQLGEEVDRGRGRRACPPGQELEVHQTGGREGVRPRSARSIAARWTITSTASSADLWRLAHRESWFRLLPSRAISRVRSRSTLRARLRSTSSDVGVQTPVRVMASRSSADDDTPAAAAFAVHAANSSGDTRACTKCVLRLTESSVSRPASVVLSSAGGVSECLRLPELSMSPAPHGREMAATRRHLALVDFLHRAWRDTLDQAGNGN